MLVFWQNVQVYSSQRGEQARLSQRMKTHTLRRGRKTHRWQIMLSETEREKIRRDFFLEHKSMRRIAREEHRGRRAIRRVLYPDTPSARLSARSYASPV